MQIKKEIDTLHETFPTYGRHNMWCARKDEIPDLTEKQIRRIMHKSVSGILWTKYFGTGTGKQEISLSVNIVVVRKRRQLYEVQ